MSSCIAGALSNSLVLLFDFLGDFLKAWSTPSFPPCFADKERFWNWRRTSFKGVPLQWRTPASLQLAFFLLAHRSALNVQRLLQRIYSPKHVYLVHVDLKSPQAFWDTLAGGFQVAFS